MAERSGAGWLSVPEPPSPSSPEGLGSWFTGETSDFGIEVAVTGSAV
jgi:hypothetical protein